MLLKQWFILGLTSLLLVACDSDTPPKSHEIAKITQVTPGFVPEEPQRHGDSKAGYDAIINKPYLTCGIPYSAYQKSNLFQPPQYGLPGRTGINKKLPYYQTYYETQEGIGLIVNNCLLCHGSSFNGDLMVGLGNESLDLTQDVVANAEGIGVYVEGEQEAKEWRKWVDRITGVAPYLRTDTIGVNSAVNLTWGIFAHRDPKTLAWSNKLLMDPPSEKPTPVSVPPWWRMKKQNGMFYSAAGRGDHARLEIMASSLCTESVKDAQVVDSYAPDIQEYIASLEPPTYPFKIDQSLATQGEDIFNTHCVRCHGTYGEKEKYPNLVISLAEIGTDPEYIKTAMGSDLDRFGPWLAQSFYGQGTHVAKVDGYLAPPLDGVWATAPYLHNGSVPTLESLLNSAQRPKYWTRTFDTKDYNDKTLGWNYTQLNHGKAGTKKSEERKKIYDTTLIGYGNMGHTFGDVLSEQERHQLLEYLKTL
ncbi:c-type cytochrome [Candidatus Nitrosacidococcus sp. I8]|uniref:c-type cytochrome n=1 Tax=Candidatus Nitrosacidococcus sp. I8 TaxID=2942908 RepID=UPI0022262AE5|nr:c-type cytochrome [Candidatus Nitrosacidococcus sp. I8]CAH9018576.1 hypothetical protein NURINAE_01005 [Candidatus Nitrosacidococcus sp. I8]